VAAAHTFHRVGLDLNMLGEETDPPTPLDFCLSSTGASSLPLNTVAIDGEHACACACAYAKAGAREGAGTEGVEGALLANAHDCKQAHRLLRSCLRCAEK
jgi:hypothetical protein